MSCTDKMYLTGNEICSDNPRDLSDNARVFDAYVNSAEFSVTDRFGVERVTLAWAKWRIDTAIDEAAGEIKAEWQTGVANINSEETAALNNINTTTAASLTSIEEAKDNAIEEIIETGGTAIVQEPGQDTNKVMSQKAVTDFVGEEIDSIVIPEPVNVVNEIGGSTTDAISQKAFTDRLNKALVAQNGWHKDEDTGLITQWGLVSIKDDEYKTFQFPIAFPNSALVLLTSVKWDASTEGGRALSSYGAIISKTSFGIGLAVTGVWANVTGVYWEAKGY